MKSLEYIPYEEEEQQQFIAECGLRYPHIRIVSTQNGFYTPASMSELAKKKYIAKLKRLGLSPGFPDLIIFAKNNKTNILFLEMKRTKKSKLSEDQKEWIKWLDEFDFYVGVAYGCNHALELLEIYLAE